MEVGYPKTHKGGRNNPNPKIPIHPHSTLTRIKPEKQVPKPDPNFAIRLHHIRFVIKLSIPDAKMSELSEK